MGVEFAVEEDLPRSTSPVSAHVTAFPAMLDVPTELMCYLAALRHAIGTRRAPGL